MVLQRLRWVREEVPLLLVIIAFVVAVVYLAARPNQWRPATTIMAAALLGAALFRLVLPAGRIGGLAVRRRWWDVVCYAAMGGVILALDLRLR